MRVFISSVVRGFEPFRDAASEAVTSLGYEAVRAEAFGARPETPRRACLKEVRASDLTIVLLGESYGTVQDSMLSATHEEFREAKDRSSVAVLVQAGVEPDPRQEEFIREAQQWAGGRFTDTFESPSELRAKVTRLLHRYALDQASGGVDGGALEARAREALLAQPNHSLQRIHVVVAGGPGQTVVRPAQLDDPEFSRSILQRALFAPEPILDPRLGTQTDCSGGRVSLRQGDRGGSLTVSEDGTVSVALPARPEVRGHAFGLVPLIEEDIAQLLENILAFVAGVLDHVDPARRMSGGWANPRPCLGSDAQV